jgi:hypothetical protein
VWSKVYLLPFKKHACSSDVLPPFQHLTQQRGEVPESRFTPRVGGVCQDLLDRGVNVLSVVGTCKAPAESFQLVHKKLDKFHELPSKVHFSGAESSSLSELNT